jgi:hypothetical protein
MNNLRRITDAEARHGHSTNPSQLSDEQAASGTRNRVVDQVLNAKNDALKPNWANV